MQEIKIWTIAEDNSGNLTAETVDTIKHAQFYKF